MSAPVLGVDIAKQRIEVALLIDGKVKNKSFKNATEGFDTVLVKQNLVYRRASGSHCRIIRKSQ
jgi:hypothetical protein